MGRTLRSVYTMVVQEWVLPTVCVGSTMMMGGEGEGSKEGSSVHSMHLTIFVLRMGCTKWSYAVPLSRLWKAVSR